MTIFNKYEHIIWDWNGTLLNDAWVFVHLMNKELEGRRGLILTIKAYKILSSEEKSSASNSIINSIKFSSSISSE